MSIFLLLFIKKNYFLNKNGIFFIIFLFSFFTLLKINYSIKIVFLSSMYVWKLGDVKEAEEEKLLKTSWNFH